MSGRVNCESMWLFRECVKEVFPQQQNFRSRTRRRRWSSRWHHFPKVFLLTCEGILRISFLPLLSVSTSEIRGEYFSKEKSFFPHLICTLFGNQSVNFPRAFKASTAYVWRSVLWCGWKSLWRSSESICKAKLIIVIMPKTMENLCQSCILLLMWSNCIFAGTLDFGKNDPLIIDNFIQIFVTLGFLWLAFHQNLWKMYCYSFIVELSQINSFCVNLSHFYIFLDCASKGFWWPSGWRLKWQRVAHELTDKLWDEAFIFWEPNLRERERHEES